MSGPETSPAMSRRNPMRQWLGIEISAYALGVVVLVTAAWEHGNASDAAAFIVWALAAAFIGRTVIGIYGRQMRSRQPDQRSRADCRHPLPEA